MDVYIELPKECLRLTQRLRRLLFPRTRSALLSSAMMNFIAKHFLVKNPFFRFARRYNLSDRAETFCASKP